MTDSINCATVFPRRSAAITTFESRIQNQSHAGGFRAPRRLFTIASRSRSKAPSSVAVEPCFFASRSDSKSSRRWRSVPRTTATGCDSCSITTSAPARTRFRIVAKSLVASASDTWITFFGIFSLYPSQSICSQRNTGTCAATGEAVSPLLRSDFARSIGCARLLGLWPSA